MKRLFVARHGEYGGPHDRLDRTGKDQMERLADAIDKIVPEGETIAMVSSNAPRAIDSAMILSEKLCVEFEARRVLWSDNGHRWDREAAGLLVLGMQNDADNIVVVTHLELTAGIPYTFRQHFDGEAGEISKGDAWIIDFPNRTIKRLEP